AVHAEMRFEPAHERRQSGKLLTGRSTEMYRPAQSAAPGFQRIAEHVVTLSCRRAQTGGLFLSKLQAHRSTSGYDEAVVVIKVKELSIAISAITLVPAKHPAHASFEPILDGLFTNNMQRCLNHRGKHYPIVVLRRCNLS